jgi:hypothetical protein
MATKEPFNEVTVPEGIYLPGNDKYVSFENKLMNREIKINRILPEKCKVIDSIRVNSL